MSTSSWREYRAAFSRFLLGRGLSEDTRHVYERDVQDVVSFFVARGDGPQALDIPRLDAYVEHIGRKLAPTTIIRRLVSCRQFLRFLAKQQVINGRLAEMLEGPARTRSLPKVLSCSQVVRLIDAVRFRGLPMGQGRRLRYLGRRDAALVETLYASGCRVAELCHMRLCDLDLDAGRIRVFGKGSKERLCLIGRPAVRALRAYLRVQRPDLVDRSSATEAVFVSRRGQPMDPAAVWRVVKKAGDRCGFAGVSPHTLRHCFATHLLAGGASLRTVQELLGHANVATTQIYTHITVQHLRTVHRRHHPR
jgi:integrase/recombinase XerD